MTSHRILVVDDEPLNLELLEQELEERDYEVETALDGASALAMVEASPPDLILLDVIMPGIDGIEVCRRLKADERTRLIPVIIMTALSDDESRISGVEAGADDFLTKPIDDRELFARMRNALRIKDTIDDVSRQLQAASEQIARLGKHDEEVAVVVAMGGVVQDRDRFEERAASLGGIKGVVSKGGRAAFFRGADAAASARLAVQTAVSMRGSSLGLGIAVGSALLGADRVDAGVGSDWNIRIDGPAVGEALVAAETAEPGTVFAGKSVIAQLGTGFGVVGSKDLGPLELFRVVGAAPRGPDTGSYELDFPTEYAELLSELRDEWKVNDLFATKSLSGKSGASVLAVDISLEGFSGQAILKLEVVEDDTADEDVEAERHRRAIDRGGEYAERRLPRLIRHMARHGMTATLSTIAAGGLEYCQPWFRTAYDLQVASAERVANDILENWNAEYTLEAGLVSPDAVVQRWLAYRLDPERGRLDALMTDLVGVSPHSPALFIDGSWYPNPVAFARNGAEIATLPAIRPVLGQIHGDLNGYNVLMTQRRSDVADYYLIDLAFYEEDNYLFFDHGYIELAYLLRAREDAGSRRWLQLLEGVFAGQPVNADDLGAVRIVDAIRRGQRKWIDDHEEHRASYMASQMLLAQIGAGLNFANKRISARKKLHGFLYATVALREFLSLNDVAWPRTGEMATLE